MLKIMYLGDKEDYGKLKHLCQGTSNEVGLEFSSTLKKKYTSKEH